MYLKSNVSNQRLHVIYYFLVKSVYKHFEIVYVGHRRQTRTLNARVRDFKIALEILIAGLSAIESRVRHADVTDAPARAAPMHVVDDVNFAADETEVGFDAATERHASVLC